MFQAGASAPSAVVPTCAAPMAVTAAITAVISAVAVEADSIGAARNVGYSINWNFYIIICKF